MSDDTFDFLVRVASQPEADRKAFVSTNAQKKSAQGLSGLERDILKCLLGIKPPGAAAAVWIDQINRVVKQNSTSV